MQHGLCPSGHRLAQIAIMLGGLLCGSVALAQGVFTVNQPWVKPASRVTEAYMVLMASEGAIVISARSSLAARASFRAARAPDKGIELPPGQPITLKPGAVRIVLSGLVHPLKLRDRVPLVLTIQRPDGAHQDISVDAEVRNESPVDAELRAHRH